MLIPSKEINFDSSKPYNGVFYYFQSYTGFTDIYTAKFVNASVSTIQYGSVQTPLIDKDEANTCCYTTTDPDQWYEIDFMENRFSLKKYTYRAQTLDYFREWYLYGYNRIGEEYKTVHHIQNYVNEKMTNTFDSINERYFRYFRVVPIGTRYWDETARLSIHRLEFFGKFVNAADLKAMQCTKHLSHSLINRFVFALIFLS